MEGINIQEYHYTIFLNWIKNMECENTLNKTEQSQLISSCYKKFKDRLDDTQKRDAFRKCVQQLEDNGAFITDDDISSSIYLTEYEKRFVLFQRFSSRALLFMSYPIHLIYSMTPRDRYYYCRSFDEKLTKDGEYCPEKRIKKVNDIFIKEFGTRITKSFMLDYEYSYCSDCDKPDSIS